MFYIETIIAVIIAYLIGSLSSAIIVCRLMGLPDPRTVGSLNPGATNVYRLGKVAGISTLIGDVLKGFVPVLIAIGYGLEPITVALVAFAAIMGHLYPIFFNFKGGKGVATELGCLLAMSLPASFCWLATFFLVGYLSRYVALASIISSLAAPLYLYLFTHQAAYALIFVIISFIILYRHHTNITRILEGSEVKISQK